MNLLQAAPSSEHSSSLSYTVALEKAAETKWTAIALGGWNCKAEGNTREEALFNLKQVLVQRLTKIELVQQTIPLSNGANPWLRVAGKYEDDPQFDAVLEHIASYRRELEAERQVEESRQDKAGLDQ